MTDNLRFASNELHRYIPPNCERCGKPAKNTFAAVTEMHEPVEMYYPARHWCETPDCVDERGYNSVRGDGRRAE